jgi:chromatin remodeling complex protein RSC6
VEKFVWDDHHFDFFDGVILFLQDPANKKMIVCDSKLQELFECDTFVGFGITKLLSPHFLKA